MNYENPTMTHNQVIPGSSPGGTTTKTRQAPIYRAFLFPNHTLKYKAYSDTTILHHQTWLKHLFTW